jgi:transmembrane sensor
MQRRAAEWLALRQARGLTPAEQADFADWCAADPRHARVFAEVEAAWIALDGLARYPHSPDVAADPDLLRPVRRRPRVFAPLRHALAAAAALALSAAWVWKPWATSGRATADAVTAAGSRIVPLPDGSLVELNVGAEVEPAFSPAERRVRLLHGEAHFTVTKNPDRPFWVEANGVAVRAVGTAFDVRLVAASVEVLVTEGTVQVHPSVAASSAGFGTAAVLNQGQKTVVSTQARDSALIVESGPAAVLDQSLAWQSSRFLFEDMPLAEVVERFNRSGTSPVLLLDDPGLATLRFSGRMRASQVDSFVEVLEANFGIRAERRSDGRILLRRAR